MISAMRHILIKTATFTVVSTSLAALLPLPCLGGEKSVVVEGYVRDEAGQPVRGAWVYIASTERQAAADTLVVPIITKNTVAVVGAKFPPSTIPKFIADRGTDKRGHYKFRVPAKYSTYSMNAQCCHTMFSSQHISHSKEVTVNVEEGPHVNQDFVVEKNLAQ